MGNDSDPARPTLDSSCAEELHGKLAVHHADDPAAVPQWYGTAGAAAADGFSRSRQLAALFMR